MWLFDLSFPSILQIWYVEERISRNISEGLFDFEISGVDCICVSLWCFTDEAEDPCANWTYFFFQFGAASDLRVRFRASKTCLSRPQTTSPPTHLPTHTPPPHWFQGVPLLQFVFVCASAVLNVAFVFYLFVPHLSFHCASGGLSSGLGLFLDVFTYIFVNFS